MRRNCIYACYASSQQVEHQIPHKLCQSFAVPFRYFKNWVQPVRLSKIITNEEKVQLLSNYESEPKSLSRFDCMKSFYNSESYDRIAYIETLEIQNYWWWRQHFIYETYEEERTLRSDVDPEWWKSQCIDSEGEFKYMEDDSDEEEDDSDAEDDDSDAEDDEYGSSVSSVEQKDESSSFDDDTLMNLIQTF